MTYSISLSENDTMIALRAFLLAILPSGTEIIQTQSNNVPMPQNAFVAMTHIRLNRLSTNIDIYDSDNDAVNIIMPTQHDIQIDFYGPIAGDWANMAQALFRDSAGVSLFPSNIVPLYADNAVQMPLITGEETYLERWKLAAALQYNPVISAPQQFFDGFAVDVISVDEKYPPDSI
jgi:hypothetical protein